MIYNYFQEMYIENPFDVDSIRRKAITPEEFKEKGLSDEAIKQYFSLIKRIYEESAFYSLYSRALCDGEHFTQLHKLYEGINEISSLVLQFLQFCVLNSLIDISAYDFYKTQHYKRAHMDTIADYRDYNENISQLPLASIILINDFPPDIEYQCFPEKPEIYSLETIEEYRYRLEKALTVPERGWYLRLRYNCSYIGCPSGSDGEKKDRLCRYENRKLIDLSLAEASALIDHIKSDAKQCYLNIKTLEKNEGFDWLHKRIEINNELSYLEDAYEDVTYIFSELYSDGGLEDDNEVCVPSILYLYRRQTVCHQKKHPISQATAVIRDIDDKEIKINVEYCSECEKYYLDYQLFYEYREKYNILIGNFIMYESSGDYSSDDVRLAVESPLKLSGYNVSQADNLSSKERHTIWARILYDGIMSKGDVIKYLSYFIRTNGQKTVNDLALKKWKEDLEFVQKYNINTQPLVYINRIEPIK